MSEKSNASSEELLLLGTVTQKILQISRTEHITRWGESESYILWNEVNIKYSKTLHEIHK